VTDLEARIVQSNQAGEKFTGVPLAEIVGQTCCKLVHGTDAPIPGCPLQKMLRTHHRETAELRLPDGDQWLIVTVDPVKDMDGNLVGAVHIARDITKRKRAEEALRESEERYRIIIESIEDGYYEVDIAGNFTFFNDSLCEIMGYTRDELMGMNNRHYMDGETAKKVYQSFNKVYTTGKPDKGFEYETIRKDGTSRIVEVSISLTKDSEGQGIGFCGIVRDVTKRKQVEEALKESEERYRGLFEHSTDFVYTLDLEGNLTEVNQAAQFLTGYTRAELIGMNNRDYTPKEAHKRILQAFNRVFETGEPLQDFPLEVIVKDGGKKYFETSVALLRKGGKIIGFQGSSRDITERKRRKLLSKQLITLLEADRRSVAIELHDQIGQTLTALKMDLEMVPNKLKATDPDVKDILQSAEDKATQAMRDLRQVAHGLRPSALDDLGLTSALRVLFDDIKQRMDMEINFFRRNIPKQIEPEKKEAIYRIIQEALINVVKHANAKKVFVNLIKEEKSITLGVEDDGVGFDVSKAMKVSKGSGPLGLLIMQERAVQADGEFSVESRINGGTHLFARIPV